MSKIIRVSFFWFILIVFASVLLDILLAYQIFFFLLSYTSECMQLTFFKCCLNGFLTCSLKYINVAMVTVLKNVTNVITAVGETYLFKKQHGNQVWAALFLMVMPLFEYSSYVLQNSL